MWVCAHVLYICAVSVCVHACMHACVHVCASECVMDFLHVQEEWSVHKQEQLIIFFKFCCVGKTLQT